ncbi:DNA replication ATP-dependent helicase/nuclease DNA2 [Trichoplax sp. H2]|nr:DNA replication ATP-dependent helicase/nuclease DNA2 [Trichoplax sp. H2]|eukprot:RDD47872.1 DNA replication ATP-dependent helicase/nuclease DNA2 [Trichoplax sp. H2]
MAKSMKLKRNNSKSTVKYQIAGQSTLHRFFSKEANKSKDADKVDDDSVIILGTVQKTSQPVQIPDKISSVTGGENEPDRSSKTKQDLSSGNANHIDKIETVKQSKKNLEHENLNLNEELSNGLPDATSKQCTCIGALTKVVPPEVSLSLVQVENGRDNSVVEVKQNPPLHEVVMTECDNLENVMPPKPRTDKLKIKRNLMERFGTMSKSPNICTDNTRDDMQYNESALLEMYGSVTKKVKVDESNAKDIAESNSITCLNDKYDTKEKDAEKSQSLDTAKADEDAVDILLRKIKLTPVTDRYLRPSRVNQSPFRHGYLSPKKNDLDHELEFYSLLVKSVHVRPNSSTKRNGIWGEASQVYSDQRVNLMGKFNHEGKCILDNENKNLIITDSDCLVSGTSISTATKCLRRAVLDELFKVGHIEADQGVDKRSEVMLFGTMLHDLFEMAMRNKSFSRPSLQKYIDEILVQPKYLRDMYRLGCNEQSVSEIMQEQISSIEQWASRYVRDVPHHELGRTDFQSEQDTSVCISQLYDIEENIWSPRYGLKGKIDATVEVKIHKREKGIETRDTLQESHTIPLELKTGKMWSSAGSLSHRAQARFKYLELYVIIYSLMLSDRLSRVIPYGLLYYSKSGDTVGVPAKPREKRALIMMRNQLANYYTHLLDSNKKPSLPEVINDYHACKRCSRLKECTLYHRSYEKTNLSSESLQELYDNQLQHLSELDLEYFSKWFNLIALEYADSLNKSCQADVWTTRSTQREKEGFCIANLKLMNCSNLSNNEYGHLWSISFERSECPIDNSKLAITVSERVIISRDDGSAVNIATGTVTEIGSSSISVITDRDFVLYEKNVGNQQQFQKKILYRIDTGADWNTTSQLWANLSEFCSVSESDSKLRRLIVNLDPPTFDNLEALEDDDTLKEQMCNLNNDQKCAIYKASKTTTIAHLIWILSTMGKSVLLTAYTHTAVDNVLLKLAKFGVDFVRLGRPQSIHPNVLPFCAQNCSQQCRNTKELGDFYSSKAVVATTCLGINHAIFSQRRFDYCILDEASQVTQPVCIGPLRFADIFVLVGDHHQLPPLVQSLDARDGGMNVSLFQRLCQATNESVAELRLQYRMHRDIMALSNSLVYNNRLQCATQAVENETLELKNWSSVEKILKKNSEMLWLLQAVNPSMPVVFINTDNTSEGDVCNGSSIYNEFEAVLTASIVRYLIEAGANPSEIGVLSPYKYQLHVIREKMKHNIEASDSVEVHTIDRYQGRDKDCIIISLVRKNMEKKIGQLLLDKHRINVAITRSKKKLILIGSWTTLQLSHPMTELLNIIQKNNWMFSCNVDLKHCML